MAAYRRVYDSRHLQAAKNLDQLRNPTIGTRVWATFYSILILSIRTRKYVTVWSFRPISNNIF